MRRCEGALAVAQGARRAGLKGVLLASDSRGEAARTGDGCDCIHAVTDMDPAYPRAGYPLLLYGQAGDCKSNPQASCFDQNRWTDASAISIPPFPFQNRPTFQQVIELTRKLGR